jgi:lactoylglutathione lyase
MTLSCCSVYLRAGSPDISEVELYQLSTHESSLIRTRVAENPNCSPGLLDRLSEDTAPDVRVAVATNPKTSILTAYRLAHDKDATVRYALAEDHNLPPGVLRILVKDENPYVSCRAKRTIDALSNAAATKSEPKGLVHWHSFSNRNFA